LLNASGWAALNWIVLPATALILVPLVWSMSRPASVQV
jgi:hypothetical protein